MPSQKNINPRFDEESQFSWLATLRTQLEKVRFGYGVRTEHVVNFCEVRHCAVWAVKFSRFELLRKAIEDAGDYRRVRSNMLLHGNDADVLLGAAMRGILLRRRRTLRDPKRRRAEVYRRPQKCVGHPRGTADKKCTNEKTQAAFSRILKW